MAYAAVLSLENTINGVLHYSPPETLRSALDHTKSLRYTLEECSVGVGDMDEQMMIIEAAIKLEDAIEFSLLSHQSPTFSLDLNHDIHCFVQTAKEREQIIEGLWEQKAAKEIEEDIEELFLPKPDPEDEEEDVEMVGLCDQFLQIRDMVLAAHEEPESSYIGNRVIGISGMAGIGKTALAKKVFHDPLVKTRFRSRAFIRLGLKFWSAERIVQAIRDQLNLDNRGMTQNFLLFLDDVWNVELIWSLYDQTWLGKEKGIVILFTSRTHALYFTTVKIRFMNEEESWELLRRKVFGEEEEYCPPQLVKPGKKIAEKCEDLPLLINTVAPILLSKAQKDPERWNRVAHKPDSILEEASHQISQDESIKKSCDLDESIKSHRRLAIQENVLLAIKEVHNKIASITNVRSLLCNGPYNQYEVPICWEWKLLKVLRVLSVRFYEFPVEVVKLFRLKYLALTCNANLPPSISKLCNLQFLIVHQHLNVKRVGARSYLPVEIWYLKKLIHLEITGRNLPDPPRDADLSNLKELLDVGVESCTKGVLKSLPGLKKLRIQIELAPDPTQTSICFDHISSMTLLESFQSVIVNSTLSSPPPPLFNFGYRLKKLSLSGFGYPWEDMSKIAEIEWLRELRLECYAFRGEKWEAKEMRFQSLHRLLIADTDLVQWTAGYENFPRLCNLTMKNCYKLRETPTFRILYVELVDCNPLVETWTKQCYECDVKYSWKGKVKS